MHSQGELRNVMQSRTMLSARMRKQLGSSLLEVLIAVLVLAIGMLGMAALEAVTLKNSNSSAARSQAVIQVYSLFDTLRLNRDVATAGGYNVATWTCSAGVAAADDPTDYSVFNSWLAGVQGSLGDAGACGRIVCGTESCTVGVRWDDSRATGGTSEPIQIETSSRL